MKRILMSIAVLGLVGSGCAQDGGGSAASSAGPGAAAALRDAGGRDVGRATLRAADGGAELKVEVTGLPAGVHGVHVHTVGKCDAPDFASAGGHWNPAGRQHGRDNPAGMHMGDLPNLTVGADGKGRFTATLQGASVTGLLDADGAALVVHAAADDYRTDPSGNSGARIACGLLTAS